MVKGGVERVERAEVKYVERVQKLGKMGKVVELGEMGEVVELGEVGEVGKAVTVVELGEVKRVEEVVELGYEVERVLVLVGLRKVRGLGKVCFVIPPMEQHSKAVVDISVRGTAAVTLELAVFNAEVIYQAVLPPKNRW